MYSSAIGDATAQQLMRSLEQTVGSMLQFLSVLEEMRQQQGQLAGGCGAVIEGLETCAIALGTVRVLGR